MGTHTYVPDSCKELVSALRTENCERQTPNGGLPPFIALDLESPYTVDENDTEFLIQVLIQNAIDN